MLDAVVLVALLASFATWIATHLTIVVRLLWRARPRYRGLVALLVAPLAPIWAHANRWRRLCWLWIGSVVVYALAVAAASF